MPQKSSKEEFVEKARKVHGDKYDYSEVIYVGSTEKVKLSCPEHGSFIKTPNAHIAGQGCPKCALRTRAPKPSYTTEYIVEKCKQTHGDKYDYSETIFTKARENIRIRCKVDGHGFFYQDARHHILGRGCPKCSGTGNVGQEWQIEKAKKLHNNKYDYSKTIYKNNRTKVIIICKEHGEFLQPFSRHLIGRGCPKCGVAVSALYKLGTRETFIQKAILSHGEKYDYSEVEYERSNRKVNIVCREHGRFSSTPNNHLTGKGCPSCVLSRGEGRIKTFLDMLKIDYIQQARFDDCKSIKPLPFDFFIPSKNIIIEFDGEQHLKMVDYFGGQEGFEKRIKHDAIKTKFCLSSGITLVRIRHDEYKSIDKILTLILGEKDE